MAFDMYTPEARARVGRVLNEKWTLEELIGVGGMAAVYRGRHRNEARAAVKVLHPSLARHPGVRERFLREGYAANTVKHRGAVQVLDDDVVKGGEDDGAAYLVMELLEGESLEARCARPPPIGEQELLTIVNGVLSVLEAAHAHGVVHRDLKPENIFLARDPDDGHQRIKVLDFGLACLTDTERTTALGLALGTPSYMSPEQAAGRSEEIDGRTDLFALGASAFRLLTHRRVHEEDDVLRLVGKMANEPAPPVRSVAPSVSEAVATIIDRALAFRREDRYPNAAAMRADVMAALDVSLPSSTRLLAATPASGAPIQAPEAPPSAPSDEQKAPPPAPQPRRLRWPFALLPLFAAVGFAYWLRPRPRSDAAPPIPDASTTAPIPDASITVDASEPDADPAPVELGDVDADIPVAPSAAPPTPPRPPRPTRRPFHPPTVPSGKRPHKTR